jgi:hypothetical protein
MTNKGLHPSIENFKVFVKNNPRVMEEVRSGKVTLQELYEEWFLLGEEDTRWDDFRSEKKEDGKSNEANADWMRTVLGTLKNMDPNQMQHYLGHLSQAIGAIQGVVAQFQNGSAQKNMNSSQNKPNNPFSFRKD